MAWLTSSEQFDYPGNSEEKCDGEWSLKKRRQYRFTSNGLQLAFALVPLH